jgi:hypothetical protein
MNREEGEGLHENWDEFLTTGLVVALFLNLQFTRLRKREKRSAKYLKDY